MCTMGWGPEEDTRSPRNGLIRVSHHMGSRNQTWVLFKNSECSYLPVISVVLELLNVWEGSSLLKKEPTIEAVIHYHLTTVSWEMGVFIHGC